VRIRRAFTLIELLVVIGIIAVLVGILLPVLNATRGQARSVACMNNMRQVTSAVGLYASANGNRLPWNYFMGDKGEVTWNGIVLLAVSKALSVPVVNDIYTSDVLICPADENGATGADAYWSNVPVVQARYRNSGIGGNPPTLPTLVTYGACLRLMGVFDPGNPTNTGTTANTETMRMRTHYTLSGSHPTWQGNWIYVFPGYQQLPFWYSSPPFNPGPTKHQTQLKITQCRKPSESWIVYENSNSDTVPGNMVFRHPHISANFGYLDGHVENLRTTGVDAKVFPQGTFTILYDSRINLTP
jgi:prepilin-type N-terminal cleavage/methylation domain-containing protein/prepilin-type processing-associated H-X9-DG protein